MFSFCYISTNKLYKYILILFQGHNCWLWSILSQLRDYLGIYFRCIFTLALGVPGMCRVASCCCNCHAILAGNPKLASSQWQNTGSWKGKKINKRLTEKLLHQLLPTILWFYLQLFRSASDRFQYCCLKTRQKKVTEKNVLNRVNLM